MRALRLRRREARPRAGGNRARPRGRRARRRGVASRSCITGRAVSARAAAPGTSRRASSFAAPTIVPGGFAERVRATDGVELPDSLDDARGDDGRAARLRASRSRARAARPRARRRQRLRRTPLRRGARAARRRRVRGRRRPARAGRAPDGPVDAAVVCARGAGARRRSTPCSRAARCSSSPTRASSPPTSSTGAS